MTQGEEYNELGFEDEELEYDESAENTKAGYDTFWGIPKKIFIPLVAGVVIVVLLIILFATRKGGTESEDDIVYPTDTVVDTSVPADTETVTSTAPIQVFDESATLLGTIESRTDGVSVIDVNGNYLGTFSTTSGDSQLYNSMSVPIGYLVSDTGSTETSTEETVVDEDIKVQLRKLGYTGDEIELALSNGLSTEALIEQATALRDAEAKEALIRIQDSASDEFKYIVNNSIFCMEEKTFDVYDHDIEGAINYKGSYIVNADYEKCPVRGYQLYIKCKIANDTYVFYDVSPDRWGTLPDSGNIVLRIQYTIIGSHNPNMYITEIEEVNTTEITVNPEDSASDLNDIINDSSNGNAPTVSDDEENSGDAPSTSQITSNNVWW